MPATPTDLRRRRAARDGSRVAAAAAAISTMLALWAIIGGGSAGAAGVAAGAAQVVQPAGTPSSGEALASGGSATSFSLKLPSGAACASDGNNGGRWHTYMVPSTEDPGALAFAGNGALVGSSTASGGVGVFRNSLYSTTGVPVRGQAPNVGDAAVINIPNFRFSVWSPGNIPPGTYDVGIACVDLDLANAMDNYWNVVLDVEADAQDPAGIRWAVSTTPATTTTTTSTTSTTLAATTTTTAVRATTTTSAAVTTTTVAGGVVAEGAAPGTGGPTAVPPAPSTGAILGASVAGGGGGGAAESAGQLPVTGAPTIVLLVSAGALLVFGRMAMLLGRETITIETV